MRSLVVTLAALLTFGCAALRAGNLSYVWTLPDGKFYLLMAQQRFGEVPAPFSARVLAPLVAHDLAATLHAPNEQGFVLLAYVSVLIALLVAFHLAARTRAPRWTLLLWGTLPFWTQLLRFAGLPDPLYTALLAGLLLALEAGWLTLAALLIFPLMLTRESTSLTLFCLLIVGWRRLGWARCTLALAAAGAGALEVRHLRAGSLPNPEHLSGGAYMAGKLVANTLRNLGVIPWSDVYPGLCNPPLWTHTLRVGPVHSIGVCSFSAAGPLQATTSLLTIFGVLPALLLGTMPSLRTMLQSRALRPASLLTRFSLLYGGLCVLLAPSLGTWFERLFAYGWPLFLVALPRALSRLLEARSPMQRPLLDGRMLALVLAVQTVVFLGSQPPIFAGRAALFAVLEAALIALLWVHVRRRPARAFPG